MKTLTAAPNFSSFFMAGFECTAALAGGRRRLNLLKATKHDIYCRPDYQIVKAYGITTVREGLSWHRIDKGGKKYDFGPFEKMMRIGREENMQQLWDLNHFDYPKDLDPFSPQFPRRFTEYARRAVATLRKYNADTLYISPINEISFLAWIGADKGWWAPYTTGRHNGFKFKSQLVRATLAAQEAIRRDDHNVRFLHIDPFMRRVTKAPASQLALDHVRDFNEVVRYEVWDMLAGKSYPELGGAPEHLDIVGMNYYFHNQEWVISITKPKPGLKFQAMNWNSKFRIPFHEMISEVYKRYQRPIIISETGSVGPMRTPWWRRVLLETEQGLEKKLPLYGVCAYPTLDRPDSAGFLDPKAGLWDFDQRDKSLKRIPYRPALEVVRRSGLLSKN